MRRHLAQHEAKAIHAAVEKALDDARQDAQAAGAAAGLDLASVDWEVADAAARWGMALHEELCPGPQARFEVAGPGDSPVDRASPTEQPTASEGHGSEPVDKSGSNGEAR